ncbi:hypothetical protein SELMODRAFT_421691 [Selaginella moellendorffii]|uniref:Uncharacterized protein n=1 Tax=Selaginella moellendorffii TaxID=88036 RepID=D8SG25_SELML|nr:hypothetical protein SELMODRAFT_421691 [Selaginella moellendorffii]
MESHILAYVLSNELVSMAFAMVAKDKQINRVLEELFSEEHLESLTGTTRSLQSPGRAERKQRSWRSRKHWSASRWSQTVSLLAPTLRFAATMAVQATTSCSQFTAPGAHRDHRRERHLTPLGPQDEQIILAAATESRVPRHKIPPTHAVEKLQRIFQVRPENYAAIVSLHNTKPVVGDDVPLGHGIEDTACFGVMPGLGIALEDGGSRTGFPGGHCVKDLASGLRIVVLREALDHRVERDGILVLHSIEDELGARGIV